MHTRKGKPTCRQALRRRRMQRRHAVRRHPRRRVVRRRQYSWQRRRQGGPGEGVAGAEQQPGQAAGGDGARKGGCEEKQECWLLTCIVEFLACRLQHSKERNSYTKNTFVPLRHAQPRSV